MLAEGVVVAFFCATLCTVIFTPVVVRRHDSLSVLTSGATTLPAIVVLAETGLRFGQHALFGTTSSNPYALPTVLVLLWLLIGPALFSMAASLRFGERLPVCVAGLQLCHVVAWASATFVTCSAV